MGADVYVWWQEIHGESVYLPFALAESIKLFLFVCLFVCFKNFPDSTTVKPMSSNAEGKGLIPGLRAKILHASQPKKKNKKQKNHVKQKQILKQSQSRFFLNGLHQKNL